MNVALDHLSVPARDKVATAEFYAHVFGVRYEGPRRHFAPIVVNETA
jgi:predicted enzyme related to lactoylglutathione lyase